MTYRNLWTDDDERVTVTGDHLIYSTLAPNDSISTPTQSDRVQPGHYLFKRKLFTGRELIVATRVVRLSHDVIRGVYAPLTTEGTIVVDDIVTSCYASLNSHALAHLAMAPFRFAHHVIGSRDQRSTPSDGVHWYAEILLRFAEKILPDDAWYR